MATTTDFSSIKVLSQSAYDNLSSVSDDTLHFVELPIASYIIEEYINGTSGYRIWSNGFCVQWGITTTSGSTSATKTKTVTVTVIKEFADTNYHKSANAATSAFTCAVYDTDSTTTTFNITCANKNQSNSASLGSVSWQVSGYLAEGEY